MSSLLDEYPNLAAYVARGEARPAYKRAFDAQLGSGLIDQSQKRVVAASAMADMKV
jgi:hypothetical protein